MRLLSHGRFISPAEGLDLTQLRGYVLLVLGAAHVAAALLVGGDPFTALIVPALVMAGGTALLVHPEGAPRLQPALPFITTTMVIASMLLAPPALAPYGLAYLVLIGTFAHVTLPARLSNAVTATGVLGLCAWSFVSGRPLLADVLSGTSLLLVSAAAARYVADTRRVALDQAQVARRSAEQLSLRDPLTNLPNRRAFDTEADLRAIEGRLGGVLIVDIDHFKAVNDEFGHPAGDEVLVEVARRLAGALRRADLPARLGGDEFAVLIEGPLAIDGLRRVADAVRGATSAFAADTQAGYVKITTSIGGALVPLDVPESRRVRAVRALADRALYQAKQAGRDRAVIDGEQHSPSARRGRRRPRQGPKAA